MERDITPLVQLKILLYQLDNRERELNRHTINNNYFEVVELICKKGSGLGKN